jgi:LPPG:FO 2-phospho-L-lactate transferase
MRASGFEVSAAGVARCYAGIVDGMVIDSVDEGLASDIAGTGLRVSVTDTIMRDSARKRALAQAALDLARELGGRV